MKKVSLTAKLMMGFFLLVLITGVIGWRGMVNMDVLNSEIGALKDNQFKPARLISESNIALLAWNRALLNFTNSSTREDRESYQEIAKERSATFKSRLESLKEGQLSDRGREMVDNMSADMAKSEKVVLKIYEEGFKGSAAKTSALMSEKLRPLVDSLDEEMTSFSKLQARQFDRAIADTDARYESATLVMLSLIIAALVFGVGLALLLAKSIINPFKKIFQGLSKFSAEELDDLLVSFNSIIDSLNDGATQVTSASNQISSASQVLSSTSNEQASSIEENSAALEEISGMVENNVSLSQSSNKLSDSVGSDMQDLVKAMESITESNLKIDGLVKIIGEIGEKTEVIDEIVFQTKMLSFNASVEAERAGEHGRGFAIVAQEVGNLAEMSGKAALEISEIVKNSIKEAEEVTTENKLKVDRGSNLAQETLGKAEKLSSDATQIFQASNEQSKGINQINDVMATISKSTQDLATTAEETASSSEELNGQAEALKGVVNRLVALLRSSSAGASNFNQGANQFQNNTQMKTVSVNNVVPIGAASPVASQPSQATEVASAKQASQDQMWKAL